MKINKTITICIFSLVITTNSAVAGGNAKQNPPLVEGFNSASTSAKVSSNWYTSILEFFDL